MRKKGKRFNKKKSNKSIKIFSIFIFIILLIILIITYDKYTKNKKNVKAEDNIKIEKSILEKDIETSVEPTKENVEEEEIEKEETIDTEIESLIKNIREKNNLNENNFYFFFYNIEEKKYYYYNENKYFTAASTIKVPISMTYYDKIEEGKLKKTDTLPYTKKDYEPGGGKTAIEYDIGEKIPISYLLEQSIVNSDNTALNILVNREGYKKCKEELAKYTKNQISDKFYQQNIANALYYYDVLQYLYQNTDKYKELIEHMKKSSEGAYLKAKLPQYEVAHKYGLYEEYTHDYGIIYGKNTYLIGVFTKNVKNASNLIAEIGEQVVKCLENEDKIT